jgi:hypothetical protein
MAPDPISTAYFINSSHRLCVCMCIPLSLLGNEWTQQYKKCWMHSFLYGPCRIKGESRGFVCVSQILVYVSPKRVVWRLPEPSDSKIWSWVPWDSGPRFAVLEKASNNLLGWTVYPRIVARQQVSKHVSAIKKNCCRRRYLCGPCSIKGT